MYIKLIYSYLIHGHLLPTTKVDLRKQNLLCRARNNENTQRRGEHQILRAHEKSTDLVDPLRNRNHIQRGKSHPYSIQ